MIDYCVVEHSAFQQPAPIPTLQSEGPILQLAMRKHALACSALLQEPEYSSQLAATGPRAVDWGHSNMIN